MKHIKPNLEDNKAASYAKAVRGDTKELKQELTGESKNHQGDERHDRGPSDNRFPLMVIHTIGHGQENRHRTEWLVNVKNEVKHNRAKGNKSSISIIF